MKILNLINKKFEKLTVIKLAFFKNKKSYWQCVCDCGITKIVRGTSLTSGQTKSCGCLQKEIAKLSHTKHGYRNHYLYNTLQKIIQRCTNHKDPDYKNYGKRGINVCDRWLDKNNGFKNFLEDIGERPSSKHQLDRINNNLGYFKENCHWVLSKENNRNRRNNRLITYRGKTQCLVVWAEEYNIRPDTLWHRLYTHNWSIEKALTTPIRKSQKGK